MARAHLITDDLKQGMVLSTFLAPCIVSTFAAGYLCDRFGSKIISLTCIIISVPTFIWIGVPNQNIESMVAALTLGGTTIAGASVSLILVISNILQKKLFYGNSGKENGKPKQLASVTILFAVIGSTCGIGYFTGLFLSKLYVLIGFFWLCFTFAMLLVTCIPLMAYYSENKKNKPSAQSLGKKSIVNNTRPESFAESILSDDTTVGSASVVASICDDDDMAVERKDSIIVIP